MEDKTDSMRPTLSMELTPKKGVVSAIMDRLERSRRLVWVPIPAVLAAILGFHWTATGQANEPYLLLPILNTVFTTGVAVFVAIAAGQSYLRQPALPLLMLGCGTLVFGLGSFLAAIATVDGRMNVGLTIHNSTMAIGGLFHLIGAVVAFNPGSAAGGRVGGWGVYLAYVGVGLGLAVIVVAAYLGLTPSFFIPGEGPTHIRQLVLGCAAAMFGLAGLIMALDGVRHRTSFARWYATGMGLIAAGLLAVLIVSSVGSPLSWVGRAAQYLGGIYLLVGVLLAARHAGTWKLALLESLRSDEHFVRRIMDSLYTFVFVLLPDGTLVEANRALLAAANLTIDDVRGLKFWDCFWWNYDDTVREQIREACVRVCRGEKVRFDIDAHIGGNRRLPVDFQLSPLRNEQGTITHLIPSGADIADRKRDEQRFRVLADNIPQLAWIADVHGVPFWFNQRWYAFTGTNSATMAESGWRVFHHPDHVERVLSGIEDRFARGTDWEDTFPLLGRDGQYRWFLSRAFPIQDEQENRTIWFGTGTDVTDRFEAEASLRAARDELEARVNQRTAELRQRADQLAALASQLTVAEQGERKRLSKYLHDNLQQLLVSSKLRLVPVSRRPEKNIASQVQQAIDLIDEAIAASRDLTIQLSPPILHDAGLTAGIEWLIRSKRQKYGMEVHFQVLGDPMPEREDVRLFVFESVRELLFNAVKHAGVNEAYVTLSFEEPGRLQVTVCDEGLGFDPDTLGPRSKGGRDSFGLFNIQERLVMLGGRFEIDSTPGRGARFTFNVPLLPRVEQVQTTGNGNWQPGQLKETDRVRLLLVDDHQMMREGLRSLLEEEEDFEVVGEAADGRQALALAQELQPHIVLMDFSMPNLNGIQATSLIRQELPHIGVIGLSMYEEPDRLQAMLDAGAAAYLTKSGNSDYLLDEIRRVFSSFGK